MTQPTNLQHYQAQLQAHQAALGQHMPHTPQSELCPELHPARCNCTHWEVRVSSLVSGGIFFRALRLAWYLGYPRELAISWVAMGSADNRGNRELKTDVRPGVPQQPPLQNPMSIATQQQQQLMNKAVESPNELALDKSRVTLLLEINAVLLREVLAVQPKLKSQDEAKMDPIFRE
jgi:hypothetical protein